MARNNTPARRFDVEVTVGGEVHKGSATISRGRVPLVTVSYWDGGLKTTQVGNMPQEAIARVLLRELVGERKRERELEEELSLERGD